MARLLLTQSLLSDFAWVFRKEDGYADFLRTLRREPKETSKAMFAGIDFEDRVTAYANGAKLDEAHKLSKVAREVGSECRGGQFQVRLYREIVVDGVTFLAYGVLDCLRAGEIIDIKFSKTYEVGKYLDSPQHPMYFYLCPEARAFTYLVSDGEWVYRERYTPDTTDHISTYIRDFMRWLEQRDLIDVYAQHWAARD